MHPMTAYAAAPAWWLEQWAEAWGAACEEREAADRDEAQTGGDR